MTTQDKKAFSDYRINKAKGTLDEVTVLLDNDLFNTAISRLYYACFYAATALLITKDIQTKTHAGAKQQLGLLFISTGLIDKALGVAYSDLFNMRQKVDYEDFITYSKDDIIEYIAPAKEFIQRAEALLS